MDDRRRGEGTPPYGIKRCPSWTREYWNFGPGR
uniref:Uncharacterized protein n=1 Tax=Siphoviridae sp. ctdcr45 TaxID=2825580 RepID=A0A8S5Q8K8_9CAUD|nr:MAG TPA: hypothetical protein [Siphoviridae sp. ctdcr45]